MTRFEYLMLQGMIINMKYIQYYTRDWLIDTLLHGLEIAISAEKYFCEEVCEMVSVTLLDN